MSNKSYRIKSTTVGGQTGDAVYENDKGSWLGTLEVYPLDDGTNYTSVTPLMDDSGTLLQAPDNWKELVVEEIQES